VIIMGNPKRQRSKFSRPKKPYNKERIDSERVVMKEFGLRRKKEIWRTESVLRDYRRRARELQALPDEAKQAALFDKLNSLGLQVNEINDILSIQLNDLLSRRLQTVVHRKGLASTPSHSRQLIVHGHVMISGRKAKYPGMLVMHLDEAKLSIDEKMASKMVKSMNSELSEVTENE